jgi:hypothetical protein
VAELLALAARSVRERLRSRGALAFVVAFAIALVLAAALPAGEGAGAAPAVETSLLVVGVAAALAAAGSGGDLPSDRASGAADWLAALAPSAPARRLAPVLAGAALALAVGVLGAAASAGLLSLLGRDVPTFHREEARALGGRRVSARPGASPVELEAWPFGSDSVLEVRLRPVYVDDPDEAVLARSTVRVEVDAGSGPQVLAVAPRGAFTVPLPSVHGPVTVRLRGAEPHVDLVVVEAGARWYRVPFWANVLVAGLLLALAAACVVPASVLLSRWTSAPTAVAAAAVLALVGAVHGPLLDLARDAAGAEEGRTAAGVMRAATVLAPDLSGASTAFDAARGRALRGSLVDLFPAALHALACTALLLLVPSRKGST